MALIPSFRLSSYWLLSRSPKEAASTLFLVAAVFHSSLFLDWSKNCGAIFCTIAAPIEEVGPDPAFVSRDCDRVDPVEGGKTRGETGELPGGRSDALEAVEDVRVSTFGSCNDLGRSENDFAGEVILPKTEGKERRGECEKRREGSRRECGAKQSRSKKKGTLKEKSKATPEGGQAESVCLESATSHFSFSLSLHIC